eukprot:TRINITY_DN21589_c0_g1_i1.p1 TRINITY_DN21589_c0_g1~~TRINITY_DN21589_c0_g1_i1.p1  ORF type:complete len:1107 (+),score=250.39 TRINITY_DN21589_c0_g1_i1:473-3322(+)
MVVPGTEVIVSPILRDSKKKDNEKLKKKKRMFVGRVEEITQDLFSILLNDKEMVELGWSENTLVEITPVHVEPEENGKDQQAHRAVHNIKANPKIAKGHISIPVASSLQIRCSLFSRLKVSLVEEYKYVEDMSLEPAAPLAAKNEDYERKIMKDLEEWVKMGMSEGSGIPLVNGTIIKLGEHHFRLFLNIRKEFKKEEEKTIKIAQQESLSQVLTPLGPLVSQFSGGFNPFNTMSNPQTSQPQNNSMDPEQIIKTALANHQKFMLNIDMDEHFLKTLSKMTFIMKSPIINRWYSPHHGEAIAEDHLIRNRLPLPSIGGMSSAISKCCLAIASSLSFKHIRRSGQLGQLGANHILISGKHGTGKSLLAQSVASHFSKRKDILAYCEYHSSSTLSVIRLQHVRGRIVNAFTRAIQRQPSIVILDDIDLLASNTDHDESRDPVRSHVITDTILSYLNEIESHKHEVVVIATIQSQNKIASDLGKPNVFPTQITLHPPSLKDREEILRNVTQSRFTMHFNNHQEKDLDALEYTKDIDFGRVGRLTDGYLGIDLVQLVERAQHVASLKFIESPTQTCKIPQLLTEHFEAAQEGFSPSSLKGVNLFKSNIKWEDIGGLVEVKKSLKETIEWPIKYSFIFDESPLRNRSGLLLYGPPGCGKTLLAHSIANLGGLSFIAVKGAELLNKYIGASEEAVRDKFEMASSAKPCVLFFDEFDAIAPRRGHDNTGVTDRVVNQFLTALDGVEALSGVYVVAATSRPDLIDPALLRPGRLDKSIYIGIPTKEELKDILAVQTKNLNLGSDVDLDVLSGICENFTGADTQALLYNAQLESIHDQLSYNFEKEDKDDQQLEQVSVISLGDNYLSQEKKSDFIKQINITKNNVFSQLPDSKTPPKEPKSQGTEIHLIHFKKALSTFVPSLSESERSRYESLYNHFHQSRGGEFVDLSNVSKKLTHA